MTEDHSFSSEYSSITSLSSFSQKIREILLINLSYTPIGIDELVRQCHVSAAEVLYELLALELAGRLYRYPGNKVALIGN